MRCVIVALLVLRTCLGLVVRHSFPFDSFRITCPRQHAITKASWQLIRSRGGGRMDHLFTMYCENLMKIFPQFTTYSKTLEDECRWTKTVEKSKSKSFGSSCNDNEYFAGVMRRGVDQYSFMCCQLEVSRVVQCEEEEFFCCGQEVDDIDVHKKGMLLADFSERDQFMKVKFCKLAYQRPDRADEVSFPQAHNASAYPIMDANILKHLQRSNKPLSFEERQQLEFLRQAFKPLAHNVRSNRVHSHHPLKSVPKSQTMSIFHHSPYVYREHVEYPDHITPKQRFDTVAHGSLSSINDDSAIIVDEAEIEKLCKTGDALKDERTGLPIVCGFNSDVWKPRKCNLSSLCLKSSDSNVRVCCPVRMA